MSDSHLSDGEAAIWRLVSGYPSAVRRARPLVFLQSYADDSCSNTGDRLLFMGGLVGTAENWANFSDDWEAALKRTPSIAYLKMVEAQNLKGEFRHWKEAARNEKLLDLAAVIRRYPLLTFQMSVGQKAFREYVSPHAPRAIAKPHFVTNFQVISGISQYFMDQGVKGIEFIFDQQEGVDADVLLFFEYMSKNIPDSARELISGFPQFRNDKELMPLQAADMVAWTVRRADQMGEDSLPIPFECVVRDGKHVMTHIDDDMLIRWGREFEKMPELKQLQSKPEWNKFRTEMSSLLAAGFVPPHGTPLKNLFRDLRERFARFVNVK